MLSPENIFVFTGLVELCLLVLMIYKDQSKAKTDAGKHLVVRNKKYPRSKRNAQGTWVID